MGVRRSSSPVGRPSEDLNQDAAPTVWRRRQEAAARVTNGGALSPWRLE